MQSAGTVVDSFQLFSLPRQAALDESALRDAYGALSREAHPDHGGSEEAASALNLAWDTLRTPERRLKHLLELGAGEAARAWRTVPLDAEMMDLFMKLGAALDGSGKFLTKKAAANSALARALLANEEMLWREKLEEIGYEIEGRRQTMESTLPEWDARTPDEAAWKDLAALQARFAYLAKWQTQIRERLLMLM